MSHILSIGTCYIVSTSWFPLEIDVFWGTCNLSSWLGIGLVGQVIGWYISHCWTTSLVLFEVHLVPNEGWKLID